MIRAERGLALLCLAMLAACKPAAQPQDDAVAAAVASAAAAALDAGAGQWRQPQITGCAISAYSAEDDPAGLNVHAAPSSSSKVIGKLNSLVGAPPGEEPLPSDPMVGPAFTIIAVDGDWVRIADIEPETEGFDKLTRKPRTLRNFQGLGWVHQSKVVVDTGYWDKAYDRPYHQPGPWRAIDEDAGVSLSHKQEPPARILACDKNWVKLRYRRTAAKVSGPESQREFSPAERAKFPPVEGWLKSEAYAATSAPCDPADADCKARRAREWD